MKNSEVVNDYQPMKTEIQNTTIGQFVEVKREIESDKFLTICEFLVFAGKYLL